MGETGVPGLIDQVQTAQITTVREVAQVEQPAPVIAQAPAPIVEERQSMGAAPAPVEEAAPAPVIRQPRRDRG
jgi:hypothetical protein